jgi:hypothetical protein
MRLDDDVVGGLLGNYSALNSRAQQALSSMQA